MSVLIEFVRNAESTVDISGVTIDIPDNNIENIDALLTEIGEQQVKDNKFQTYYDLSFDFIFCSPLRSSISTLLGIYPDSEKLPVILDDRLMEIPSGINIGNKRLDKTSMTFPNTWNSDKVSDITPWSIDAISDSERQRKFTEELRITCAEKNVLVVTHGNWFNNWAKNYTNDDRKLDNCKKIRINITPFL